MNEQIIDLLTESGAPVGIKEIAARLMCPMPAAKEALDRLIAEGEVVVTKKGRYMTPVWSPRGDYIAFTKQTGSTFHIGVMRPDGSDERILTTSYMDEGPTWAPNGRVLMFSRESPGGGSRLWTVDVSGRVERAAPYPGGGSDPAWSPLLN